MKSYFDYGVLKKREAVWVRIRILHGEKNAELLGQVSPSLARARFRSQDASKKCREFRFIRAASSEACYSVARELNIRYRGCKYFRSTLYLFVFSSRLYKTQFRPRSCVRVRTGTSGRAL